MKNTLQILTIAVFTLFGVAASAQSNYVVSIYGGLANCNPIGSFIHVSSIQNIPPSISTDFLVDFNCTIADSILVQDPSGTIAITYPCEGQLTTAVFTYTIDFLGNATVYVMLACNLSDVDCMGVVGGSALPGSACDDNDPNTTNDVWGSDCTCTGEVISNVDCMGIVGGSALPGTPCDDGNPDTENDTWSSNCTCIGDTINTFVDCLGVVGGSALAGTPCNDNDPNTTNDMWGSDCNCAGETNIFVDCLGVLNGSSLPGTPCDDGDPLTDNDTWSFNCTCIGDTAITFVDCLGVVGGSTLPGTPCDDNDPNTFNDSWDVNCNCQGQSVSQGCEANFWVVQGYTFGPGEDPNTIDSTVVLPIPNELWAWNLSISGTGSMTFLWSFGDGTSSTEAYPSHIYDGNGPYELCLSISDASGCTDTYCQTISVDSEGIIVGFTGDAENDNRSVLTLNVVAAQPLSVDTEQIKGEIGLWPNPVQNAINLSITTRSNGQVIMSLIDMSGQLVSQTKNTLRNGTNQLQIDVNDLKAGMYVLQISNGTQTTTRRFVKQ